MSDHDTEVFNSGVDAAIKILLRADMPEAAAVVRGVKSGKTLPVTPYRVVAAVCEATGTDERDMLSGAPIGELGYARGLAIMLIDRHAEVRGTAIADLFNLRVEACRRLSASAAGRVRKNRLWRDAYRSACKSLGVSYE